jgi:soluble lytic murein transglycosylase-like protein
MNNERNNPPRLMQPSRLRNDARFLLRSRPIQAVLLLGTLVQGASLTQRSHAPSHAADQALAPVRVPLPQRLTQLALTTAEPQEASPPEIADSLADRYRKRGYTISERLAMQIHEAAVDNGIDPGLAFGLVRTESGFKNSATSHVGATGLTQLMPATARWLEPGTSRTDLRDSETNLRIGFGYLRKLIGKYDGDTTLALLAYNRGPGTVDRLVKRGRDPDNGYADMVRGLRTRHR